MQDWLPLQGRWLRYAAGGALLALATGSLVVRCEDALVASARFTSPLLVLMAIAILTGSGHSGSERPEIDREARRLHRAGIAAIGTLVLLFLPPPVTMFRNPPPPALVADWWFRYTAAWALVFFNIYCLTRRPGAAAAIHLFSLVLAAYVGASLFLWVLEFPYSFGLPASVRLWWEH
jgi:hypothetical protein